MQQDHRMEVLDLESLSLRSNTDNHPVDQSRRCRRRESYSAYFSSMPKKVKFQYIGSLNRNWQRFKVMWQGANYLELVAPSITTEGLYVETVLYIDILEHATVGMD